MAKTSFLLIEIHVLLVKAHDIKYVNLSTELDKIYILRRERKSNYIVSLIQSNSKI